MVLNYNPSLDYFSNQVKSRKSDKLFNFLSLLSITYILISQASLSIIYEWGN